MTVKEWARGKNTHRFRSNPLELIAALHWQEQGEALLEYLNGDGQHRKEVSTEVREMVNTVMQWLGSPVGQNYMRELVKKFDAQVPSWRP